MQVAKDVILDQRDLPFGQHRDELTLAIVRHQAPERIAEVQREEAGLDTTTVESRGQAIEANALARVGRNFADAQPERFDQLQDTKIGGGLDGDGVTRLGKGHQHGLVSLRTGVRLHVGSVSTKQRLEAINCQLLDHVDVLATTVVALAGVAFGVFIGQL